MEYKTWININSEQLRKNYNSRREFIYKTPFEEYCNYIFTGYYKNMFIPEEYKIGLIF